MATIGIVPLSVQPEFVTLAEARAHLKVDHDYENELIKNIVRAAIVSAENYTGLSIFNNAVVIGRAAFDTEVRLVRGPVIDREVTVSYRDGEALVPLPDKYVYFEDFEGPFMKLVDSDFTIELPVRPDAVQFAYSVGMEKATLPLPIRQAVLLMVADMYEFRTDRTEIINRSSMALMRPYRVW
jgi:uncharacterized phiE125 gp8 family phage protein